MSSWFPLTIFIRHPERRVLCFRVPHPNHVHKVQHTLANTAFLWLIFHGLF
jgi:hypothetical protein